MLRRSNEFQVPNSRSQIPKFSFLISHFSLFNSPLRVFATLREISSSCGRALLRLFSLRSRRRGRLRPQVPRLTRLPRLSGLGTVSYIGRCCNRKMAGVLNAGDLPEEKFYFQRTGSRVKLHAMPSAAPATEYTRSASKGRVAAFTAGLLTRENRRFADLTPIS